MFSVLQLKAQYFLNTSLFGQKKDRHGRIEFTKL